MEIKLSALNGVDLFPISHSEFESGGFGTAARTTWGEALKAPAILDTPAKQRAFRAWVAEFGAWEFESIAGWSAREANALAVQFVAGWVRSHHVDDIAEWHAPAEDWEGCPICENEGGELYRVNAELVVWEMVR